MPDPTVSILIPTLNEAQHIATVMEACVRQTYPADLIDVVVSDGGSTDGTLEIVTSYADRLELLIVHNSEVHQGTGLNLAVAQSAGVVIARWDAHAEYPDTYVEDAVAALASPEVDVVGGYWRPKGDTVFGNFAAAAMASKVGVGSDRYAEGGGRRTVDTVSCGVMERATFVSVGGFDEDLRPAGEDADLMYRIRQMGGNVVLDPAIEVVYVSRSTVDGLAKQYFGYGIAKSKMFVKHGQFPSVRPLAPAALVGVLVVSAAVRRFRSFALVSAAAYVMALVVGSVATIGGSARSRLGAALAGSVMHVAYGAGIWVGLGRFISSRLWNR